MADFIATAWHIWPWLVGVAVIAVIACAYDPGTDD